jgi:hypothetical protein
LGDPVKLRHLAPVVLLVACSSGAPERGTAPAGPVPAGPLPQPVITPAIFGLFGQRQELGLTSDQINGLEAIAMRLRERNDSLETVIREEQQQRGRPRSVRDQRRAIGEALPTLGQIWSNNRHAMDEVRDVLTPEQRERVCALERERMPDQEAEERRWQERGRRGDIRPRTMRRMEADRVVGEAVRGWAWCAGSGTGTRAPAPATANP